MAEGTSDLLEAWRVVYLLSTPILFYLSSMTHSQPCVLGLQLSALEIYSVVQRCCYFVVSSLLHSLSTHLQKKSAELLIAREDLMNVRAQQTLTMEAQLQKGYGRGVVNSMIPEYLLQVKVENGAKWLLLRKTMYLHAELQGAFYGWFYYSKNDHGVVNETSDFNFVLYFLSTQQMQNMETTVRAWGQQRNVAIMAEASQRGDSYGFYDRFGAVSDDPKRVHASHYEENGSPDGRGWSEVREDYSESSATTRVSEEQVDYEFVLADRVGSHVALSCHILPAAQCTGVRAKCNKDPNNRIILDGNLHKFYDQSKPEVSFYCEDAEDAFDEHDPQSDTRKEVRLVAFFRTVQIADKWFNIGFREGTHNVSSHEIHFKIHHKDPKAFVQYLQARHNENMEKMGYAGGAPQLSQ